MQLENQVCSLELAKKLAELGINQESLFYWKNQYLNYRPSVGNGDYSAFTVAELGEMLPKEIEINEQSYWISIEIGFDNNWEVGYRKNNLEIWFTHADKSEAGARAKMLIYLKENNLI